MRKVLGKDSKPTKLDLSGKKKNKWQHSQAYSHLYYHSKLKAIVDEEYAEYCTSLPLDVEPEKIFTWRNRRVRELYENESDDVKAEVEELRNKSTPSTKEMKAVDDMLQEGLPFNVIQASMRKRSANTHTLSWTRKYIPYYRRLSALPHTVTTQMNEIAVQTGMMGLFVLAGQDPDSPEDIVIMVYAVSAVKTQAVTNLSILVSRLARLPKDRVSRILTVTLSVRYETLCLVLHTSAFVSYLPIRSHMVLANGVYDSRRQVIRRVLLLATT